MTQEYSNLSVLCGCLLAGESGFFLFFTGVGGVFSEEEQEESLPVLPVSSQCFTVPQRVSWGGRSSLRVISVGRCGYDVPSAVYASHDVGGRSIVYNIFFRKNLSPLCTRGESS